MRDDTKNGCVADYKREWSSSFSLVSQEKRFMNVKFPKKILSRLIEIWTQESGKICIFLREFLHGFLKKFWKFIILPFLAKWAKKSVDGRSIILQIPYLKQQKHELKKVANFYRGVSPWFLVKNLKFSYPSFFWPNEPIKVLLNVLYRKSLF